jgi:hypothetical protein
MITDFGENKPENNFENTEEEDSDFTHITSRLKIKTS